MALLTKVPPPPQMSAFSKKSYLATLTHFSEILARILKPIVQNVYKNNGIIFFFAISLKHCYFKCHQYLTRYVINYITQTIVCKSQNHATSCDRQEIINVYHSMIV